MDNQKRVTDILEWRPQCWYRTLRNRRMGRSFFCHNVNLHTNEVELIDSDGLPSTLAKSQWKGRFTRVPTSEA
jgi:hypothetical protein